MFPFDPGTAADHFAATTVPGREPAPPVFSPELCPLCCGARYVVDRSGDPADQSYGRLVECPRCKPATRREASKRERELFDLSGLPAPGSSLLPTFDGFDAYSPETERMYSAVFGWTQSLLDPSTRRSTPWLTLYGQAHERSMAGGNTGSGKSHLARAAVYEFWAAGLNACYVTSSKLFAFLGARWREKDDETDYEARVAWMSSLDALIIDEWGAEPEKDSVYQRRYEVLNARYDRVNYGEGGATLLISNLHPDAWPDHRLASRANEEPSVLVEATSVDYRMRRRP